MGLVGLCIRRATCLAFRLSQVHAVSKMVHKREIRKVCKLISREFRPQKIILFGSYAYGRPTADSDVDLMVIMPLKGGPIDKAIEISSRLDHRFPIDLLVRSPQEVKRRLAWNDFFLREVTEKGNLHYAYDKRRDG